jgi:hypothetical protein
MQKSAVSNTKLRSTSSIRLLHKDLKESHLLHVVEYAVCNKNAEQPAFADRVGEVMCQRDRIIKKVKASAAFLKSTKFGIQVPHAVKEALEIDRITRNTFCKMPSIRKWQSSAQLICWVH